MEFKQKLDLCFDLMNKDFGITTEQAKRIVRDMSIEDSVIEYYAEEIEDAEDEQRMRWQEEIRMNPDIYGGV